MTLALCGEKRDGQRQDETPRGRTRSRAASGDSRALWRYSEPEEDLWYPCGKADVVVLSRLNLSFNVCVCVHINAPIRVCRRRSLCVRVQHHRALPPSPARLGCKVKVKMKMSSRDREDAIGRI